jgi:hypothetical protein
VTDFRRPLHDESTLLHATPAHPTDRRLFDDEIAIDFPSLDAVVERIREEFLADDAAAARAHNAAISLSPREAFWGTTVPLDVPLRHTCSHCGGRGETWAERCERCAGSGECARAHQVRVLVPPGVTDGTRFRFRIAPPHGVPTRIEVTVLVA